MAGCKINTKKSIAFLFSNEDLEIEIRKKCSTVTKTVKCKNKF